MAMIARILTGFPHPNRPQIYLRKTLKTLDLFRVNDILAQTFLRGRLT